MSGIMFALPYRKMLLSERFVEMARTGAIIGAQKSPGQLRGFSIVGLPRRSVLGDDRATPAVVDASRDQIHILVDLLKTRKYAGSDDGRECVGTIAHEQMVVFNRN